MKKAGNMQLWCSLRTARSLKTSPQRDLGDATSGLELTARALAVGGINSQSAFRQTSR